jgi:hypothetical protein
MFYIGDNFVWTRWGPKEVREIKTECQILGIDRNGYPYWLEIKPFLLKGKTKLLHILLDRCEIIIAPRCKVCKRNEVLQAKEVNVGDKLEVFSDPKSILHGLEEEWKVKTDDKIYINGYGLVRLSLQTSYLLGILSRRTSVPALWSRGLVIIKVPTNAVKFVVNELEKLIQDFNLTGIRGDSNWSCIEFQSQIVNLVRYLPPTEELLTKFLTSSYPILHSFVKGVINASSITLNDIRRIIIKAEEFRLRKILYNLLFIHSIRCYTSSVKHYGEHDVYYIDVSSKELMAFFEMKTLSKSLSAWVMVKEINPLMGNLYALSINKKNFWSPIIDLVVLA